MTKTSTLENKCLEHFDSTLLQLFSSEFVCIFSPYAAWAETYTACLPRKAQRRETESVKRREQESKAAKENTPLSVWQHQRCKPRGARDTSLCYGEIEGDTCHEAHLQKCVYWLFVFCRTSRKGLRILMLQFNVTNSFPLNFLCNFSLRAGSRSLHCSNSVVRWWRCVGL